ncbi:MAG: sugar ABC transporter substrate-binding protein [Chloroflexi bacterium]|nr:MAG: sugar ABC transporter substrate-binding protein [Chloroflexota bacterium]
MNAFRLALTGTGHWRLSAASLTAALGLLAAACAPAAAPPATSAPAAAKPAAAPTTAPAGAAPTTAPAAKPAASGASGAVSVAMVGNPQMKTLEQLKGDFESSHPGITLNLLVLPENQIRDKVTTDISTNAGQFDLVTIGMYEVPLWAKNKWIDEVGTTLQQDANYDFNDLIPSIRAGLESDGKLYAAPFYGESSALMYRKDMFQKAGLEMPDKPTWDQVAGFAQKLHSPPNQFGICLRGLPGWGEQLAPLDTVINTYGGRWFDESWKAQLDSPESAAAINFYVNTLKTAGEPGSTQAGFTECETLMVQGKVGMWYDATSGADLVFDPKQNPSAANMGMAYAPTKEKPYSGWLWAWAFAMESNSKNKPAAYEFIKWATSKDYVNLVAQKSGWGAVPSGARKSTYDQAGYKDYAKGFAAVTLDSIQNADPAHPTVKPVPYTGVQFVQIPEFQDLGTRVSQEFAAAIAGQQSADDAIKKANDYANQVAKQGGYQK